MSECYNHEKLRHMGSPCPYCIIDKLSTKIKEMDEDIESYRGIPSDHKSPAEILIPLYTADSDVPTMLKVDVPPSLRYALPQIANIVEKEMFSELDRFEIKAAVFYNMSGFLAPGKDYPAAAGTQNIEQRDLEWDWFCSGWNKMDKALFKVLEDWRINNA